MVVEWSERMDDCGIDGVVAMREWREGTTKGEIVVYPEFATLIF